MTGEPSDRRWALSTAAVVGVMTVVALVVGANWVLSLGCGCQPPGVHAGATVEAEPDAAAVTATFTGNQDASHLLVRVDGDPVRVETTTGNASVTDDGVRLNAVGAAVTYAGAPNATVTVRVVAYPSDDARASDPRTIASEEVTLRAARNDLSLRAQ